jgi:TrmH family RNA methyltransferase
VVLESVRLVEEAVAAGLKFHGAVVSPPLDRTPRGVKLRMDLAALGVLEEQVSERALMDLADSTTPQGILAVAEPPVWALDDVPIDTGAPVLALDGLQDPGNVGTIIRSAHALGASGVLSLPGTVWLTNPKVLRASMGATFRFPVVQVDQAEFARWSEDHRVALWAADATGEPVQALNPPERLAIIVGNEGAGIRADLLRMGATRVAIPLSRGAESLNAAVAAGILLHEVVRDR